MTEVNERNLLEKLKLYRDESEEKTRESRELAKKIKRYYKGEQLPQDIIAVLQDRQQPVKWENIIKKIGNKIMGIKSSTKSEIAVYGRRVSDKAAANVYTNILRAQRDQTEWWANKKRADFDFLIAGISVQKLKVIPLDDYDQLGERFYDIPTGHVPIEQVYFDPYAMKPDFSDMRYIHIVREYDKAALYKYFDSEKVDRLVFDANFSNTASYAVDARTQRATVTYSYWREEDGKVWWAVWGEDVMLSFGKLPYAMNRFPFAIRRVFLEDSDEPGEFHGLFKDIIPLQDTINFHHLRIANMLGTVKMLFESDAVEDADEFAEEYAKDSSIVEVRPGALVKGKVKEIKADTKVVQLMELIQDARKQAEEIMGLNAEILGSAVNRMSGYAIENRQNAGLLGLQLFMDASMEQDKDLAEMSIALMQQYIKAEQVYTMMDSNEADAYFVINEIERDSSGGVVYENQKPKRRNTLKSGHYSVVLRQIPASRGSIAERQKNWTEIMKTLQVTRPEAIPALLPSMLRDTDSPVADEVAKVLEQLDASAQQNTAQQEQLKLQLAQLQARIDDLSAKAAENNAQAQRHIAEAKKAEAEAEAIEKGESLSKN